MQDDTIQTTETENEKRLPKSTREYLTRKEIDLILAAAGDIWHGKRNQCLILMTYRHGLRASEALNMKWDQIDLDGATIYVDRLKGSVPSVHYLEPDEVRLLRILQREQKRQRKHSVYVFLSERGGPLTVDAYRKMLKSIEEIAGFPFRLHPHMLRHSTGYGLANSGESTRRIQHYLGHKNIQNTVRYTTLNATQFRGWGAKLGGRV